MVRYRTQPRIRLIWWIWCAVCACAAGGVPAAVFHEAVANFTKKHREEVIPECNNNGQAAYLPNASGAVSETVCGRAGQLLGNCFRNFTPSVAVEALHAVKIPDSLEEISNRCLIFNRGMECVRQYLKECVNARQRKIIENEVYGAQKLYEFLCYDQAFQREFLRHKSCFQLVHPEWDLCSSQFIGVLKEEMVRTTKQSINVQYIQFCCARYAYENCVYSSARFICKPDSAMFLRRIAKLLSTDKHFLNCDKIENELCSGAVRQLPARISSGRLTLLGSLVLLGTIGRHFAVR